MKNYKSNEFAQFSFECRNLLYLYFWKNTFLLVVFLLCNDFPWTLCSYLTQYFWRKIVLILLTFPWIWKFPSLDSFKLPSLRLWLSVMIVCLSINLFESFLTGLFYASWFFTPILEEADNISCTYMHIYMHSYTYVLIQMLTLSLMNVFLYMGCRNLSIDF